MSTRLFKPDLASLVLRVGLAVVLLFHGYLKVSLGSTLWNPALPTFVQIVVAWGEIAAGVALLLGIVSRVAALGVIVIQLGAIWLVTGVEDFAKIQYGSTMQGFNHVSPGYEYNVTLILVSVALILLGSGRWSLDWCLFGRKTATSAAAPPAPAPTPAATAPTGV
jgi:putative oxidoreductase